MKVMGPQSRAALRRKHFAKTEGFTRGMCFGCAQDMPCETTRLLDTVDELQGIDTERLTRAYALVHGSRWASKNGRTIRAIAAAYLGVP